jgi:hypothetical protein
MIFLAGEGPDTIDQGERIMGSKDKKKESKGKKPQPKPAVASSLFR